MAETTRHEFPARVRPHRGSGSARVALLAMVALLPLAGLAPAAPSRTTPAVGVLAVQSSGDPTPQGTLTVWMKLASTANVSLVYFQFCQITHPICYTPPITMTLNATNWYVGTTKPMSSYYEMTAGESAGYNITIRFTNGTIENQPTFPNPFPSLTVGNSGGVEYVFEMSVRSMAYALQGVVTDSSTGHPISGATVTVNPGGNSTTTSSIGSYSFDGLVNGSYSLTISASGYPATTVSYVTVQGRTAFDNVSLSRGAPSGTGGSPGLLSALTHGPGLYATIGVAIVVVAGIALWAGRRNRRTGSESGRSASETLPPPDGPPT